MGDPFQLTPPLSEADVMPLRAGDAVLITGTIYTARDAAHKRLIETLEAGRDMPFDVRGQILYYVGPSPAPPGKPIGSAGPTTSGRMDRYTPALLAAGLKATIGKGARSKSVVAAMREHKAVYLAAVGGVAALLASTIVAAEPVAYEDLGTEMIRRLTVEDFPALVINDVLGNDLYEIGAEEFALDQ